MLKYVVYDLEINEDDFIAVTVDNRDVIRRFKFPSDLKTFISHIQKYELVIGHNIHKFDNIIMSYPLNSWNVCQDIIYKRKEYKSVYNLYGVESVDTFNTYKASLKVIAFKEYNHVYQNDYNAKAEELFKYCEEDVKLTKRLFIDFCLDNYKTNQLACKLLNKDYQAQNLFIYNLIRDFTYNTSYNFKDCLNDIDDDLKENALNKYNDSKKQIITREGYELSTGGIHYSKSDEFGLIQYDKCYNYDFSSYYPNLYTKKLNFFSDESKSMLNNIIERRIKAKENNNIQESNALKLIINSIYGQLGRYNKSYMRSVAVYGQVLLIQTLRDNNIDISNVIELNTDGFLLENDVETLINNTGIDIDRDVLFNFKATSVNDKMYNGKVRGFKNLNVKNTVQLFNYDANKYYNCFIVKHNNVYKYYKYKDYRRMKIIKKTNLMNKKELDNTDLLEEINVFNYEDITQFVKEELIVNYLNTYETNKPNTLIKEVGDIYNNFYLEPLKHDYTRYKENLYRDLDVTLACNIHNKYSMINKNYRMIAINNSMHQYDVYNIEAIECDDDFENIKCEMLIKLFINPDDITDSRSVVYKVVVKRNEKINLGRLLDFQRFITCIKLNSRNEKIISYKVNNHV